MEETQPNGDEAQGIMEVADIQPCYLFRLPRELRELIYEEALIHKSVLEIYPAGDPVEYMDEWELTTRSWANFRPSEPSLTRTSRQIREEALPIFYSRNIFRDSPYDACCIKFLKWLTPEKRQMLKSVRVQYATKTIFAKARRWFWRCPRIAREDLKRLRTWLDENELTVREGAIYVPVKLQGDTGGTWTADPSGECGVARCCGNPPATLLLLLS